MDTNESNELPQPREGADDIVLPAFEMDCRDWLVATPEEAGLPDELDGTPLLAVLSTAVVDEADLQSVSAVITVGLLDADAPLAVPPASGCVAAEVLEPMDSFDPIGGEDGEVVARYLVPAPCGKLALLAEFTVRTGARVSARDVTGTRKPTDPELGRRIEALMTSFRWAA